MGLRGTVRLLRWFVLGFLLLTFLASWYTSQLATILGPGVWANWLHAKLTAWSALYEHDNLSFQVFALHVFTMPVLGVLLLAGGSLWLLEWWLDRPMVETQQQLVKLEQDLEQLLVVYDRNYNFIGRLRKLCVQFDQEKLGELRRVVFQAVHEWCGCESEGKETFLIIPMSTKAGTTILSVVNEEVREAIIRHLFEVRACQMALEQNSVQLISNGQRQRDKLMTADGWILPDCQSLLVAPISVGGDVRGILGVYHRNPETFSAAIDQAFLDYMAGILSLAYTIWERE